MPLAPRIWFSSPSGRWRSPSRAGPWRCGPAWTGWGRGPRRRHRGGRGDAGLGNEDLNLHLSVSGFAVYQCQNQGGNTAPGQNKVLEGPATSDTAIPADAIKNGNLRFQTNAATLTAAPTVSGATAGCPNSNWTGVNPTLTLTSITLDIFQPTTTLIFHCTASNPNGLTSPVTLSC
jgi:hypothetical protein